MSAATTTDTIFKPFQWLSSNAQALAPDEADLLELTRNIACGLHVALTLAHASRVQIESDMPSVIALGQCDALEQFAIAVTKLLEDHVEIRMEALESRATEQKDNAA